MPNFFLLYTSIKSDFQTKLAKIINWQSNNNNKARISLA